jgi:uncharacterized protein with FMN-binding domain
MGEMGMSVDVEVVLKHIKGLTPVIALALIVALTGAPALQAIIPDMSDTTASAAETDETSHTSLPLSIKKTPKKGAKAKKVPALSTSSLDLSQCADGLWEGTGQGYAGAITVQVRVKNKKMTAIKIIKVEADDAPYMSKAQKVIRFMLKAQSVNVDTVSGATYSSQGIISAVRNALRKAAGKAPVPTQKTTLEKTPEESEETDGDTSLDDVKFKDGVYTGVGTGYNSQVQIQVEVSISEGSIQQIKVIKHSEDQPYMGNAMKVITSIVRTQSVKVDTVTGATYSSRGIIAAVKDALKKAILVEDPTLDEPDNTEDREDPNDPDRDYVPTYGMYLDGSWTGLGQGYKSAFKATVVIVDGNILSLTITHADDEEYYKAAQSIIARIVKRQTTEGIDTVSGATFSSNGILRAATAALAKAKNPTPPVIATASRVHTE